MNTENPFIHLFSFCGEYYMYDVNTNTILSLQKDLYTLLGGNNSAATQELIDELNSLKNRGYLLCNRIEEIEHPLSESLESYLKNKLQMISLQVTQNCNLRCNYCAYSGNYTNRTHADVNMTFDTAKKAVDFFIKNSIETDRVGIGFYGGEPLLQYPLIQDIVDYLVEYYPGKEYFFTITTNGTILNSQILEFLDKYNFGMMISLDGNKETHDRNRRFASSGKGTFDIVIENVKSIKECYPQLFKNLSFSVVLGNDVDFSQCSEFFTNYEVINEVLLSVANVNNNYRQHTMSLAANRVETEKYEMFKCLLSQINKIKPNDYSKLIGGYDIQLKKNVRKFSNSSESVPQKGHPSGPCVPGAQRLLVSVNGEFFPCEKVSECSEVCRIGNVEEGFDVSRLKAMLNLGKLTEKQCKNCWAYRYCTLCVVHVDEITHLSAEKKLSFCNRVKSSVEEQMKGYCFLQKHGFDSYNMEVQNER